MLNYCEVFRKCKKCEKKYNKVNEFFMHDCVENMFTDG